MATWSPDDDLPPTSPEVLAEYISSLSETRPEVATELEALESIYPSSIRLHPSTPAASAPSSPVPSRPAPPSPSPTSSRVRYQVTLPGWEDDDAPSVRVLVSLPAEYPDSAPALQLLGRYVGHFAIDAGLFGDITRTYITSTGVPFTPGEVCVFDGLVHVQSLIGAWHAAKVAEDAAGEAARAAERPERPEREERRGESRPASTPPSSSLVASLADLAIDRPLPAITTAEAIVDRKSSFVGHAARISDEEDVMAVVRHLLSDKKIARAAHPTIWAYRLVRQGAAGQIVESDYDDDGETQAGARLKHLLEILELENVLVVVSRWFGGTLLGPDRFKHINQAARDALEAAGMLEEAPGKKKRR